MTTTTKAERATITLGDIELDVFQLPDGSYRYSYELLAVILGRDKSILSDKKSPYNIKKLTGNQETNQKVKVDGIGYSYSSISQKDLSQALLSLTRLGCTNAYAYLEAAFQESLERRADAAFEVKVTEQERNIWYAQRANSKLYRRPFTDKLADENARNGNKTNYGLATLRVYKRANLSEKYKAWKCLPDTKIGFRDTLTTEELEMVIRVEDMITNFMHLRHCTFDEAMELYKQLFA